MNFNSIPNMHPRTTDIPLDMINSVGASLQPWNLTMNLEPAGIYRDGVDTSTPPSVGKGSSSINTTNNDSLLSDPISAIPWGSHFLHSNGLAGSQLQYGRGVPQQNTQHSGEDEQMQAMLRMMMLDEPNHSNESSENTNFTTPFSHTMDGTQIPFLRASPVEGKNMYGGATTSNVPIQRRNEATNDLNQGAHIASYFQNILREERETVCTPPETRFVDLNNFSSPDSFIDRLTELAQSMKPVIFVYPILDGGTCREFDVSGIATRRFGVFHGQRIRKPYGEFCSITGTIVGVGSDGALWWQRDGDSAAIRLALLPQHMTKFGLPSVIGAAMLGKLDASGIPVPPSYYVLNGNE